MAFSKRGLAAGSPRHRALCGRRPALLIGGVLLPELMEEVVLLGRRKEETRFYLKGKTLKLDRLQKGARIRRHLHGLDGSSPSVFPQDFDGLAHRHGDREVQQQAGSDCGAEGKAMCSIALGNGRIRRKERRRRGNVLT